MTKDERHIGFARYNLWANERLYAAAGRRGDDDYGAERGAFFGSVHRTLNHLLVTDRIWLGRFTGSREAAPPLDTILFDTFAPLRAARAGEDARIIAFVETLDAHALTAPIEYGNSSGQRFRQPLGSALDHLFNHQTHHRGQVHALLTGIAGRQAAPSLDLIAFQRETGSGGMRAL